MKTLRKVMVGIYILNIGFAIISKNFPSAMG
jgi:hypothetical protein